MFFVDKSSGLTASRPEVSALLGPHLLGVGSQPTPPPTWARCRNGITNQRHQWLDHLGGRRSTCGRRLGPEPAPGNSFRRILDGTRC